MTASTGVRSTRRDALPEAKDYRDDGCSAAPSCLACPFPRCRYDVDERGHGVATLRKELRTAEMFALRRDGRTPSEIAELLGVSRRTVFRLLGGK